MAPNPHIVVTPYERRKAQNRASQRAFRDRKNKELALLHAHLPPFEDKQRFLLESYSKQSVELVELRERVDALNDKMSALWACLSLSAPHLHEQVRSEVQG